MPSWTATFTIFDKTGFIMGIICASMVVTYADDCRIGKAV